MRIRATGKHAMTLIETIAALTIVSMLTATALAVAVNLTRSSRMDATRHSSDRFEPALEALMSADLTHASHYRRAQGGFDLRSRARLEPESLEIQHIPSEISYRIEEAGGQRLLIRRQKSGAKSVLNEIVCTGATGIDIATSSGTTVGSQDKKPTWREICDAATITLHLEGAAGEKTKMQKKLSVTRRLR